jgi:dTMP kinase
MELLTKRLSASGVQVMATCEPSKGDIGLLARRILKQEISVDPRSLALIFAADRNEHLYGAGGMVNHLEGGGAVVCDRYLFSSLAYQSVGCSYDFVAGLNSPFPLPEYLVFVDVAPSETQRRLSTRPGMELFDGSSIQDQIVRNYERGMEEFSDSGMHLVRVDGSQPIEVVAENIWSALETLPIQRV